MQKDFIIDRPQPRGEIDKQNDSFSTQYQQFGESGIDTISDIEERDIRFSQDLEEAPVDDPQEEIGHERDLVGSHSQMKEGGHGRSMIKPKGESKQAPWRET